MADRGTRFGMRPDGRDARKLRPLADRPRGDPDTHGTAMLCTALDKSEPSRSWIVAVLDSIPSAFDKANRGLQEIRAGHGIPLGEL